MCLPAQLTPRIRRMSINVKVGEPRVQHTLWIYFLAPTIGMLAAAAVFLRAGHGVRPYCAKLHHANNKRCIFHHGSCESQ